MKTFLAVFFGILAAGLVILGIFAFIQFMGEQEMAVETRRQLPRSHLRLIATACITYQAMFGGYPENLTDLRSGVTPSLRPDPRRAGLIPEYLAAGKVSGYLYIYKAGKRDRRGRVVGYTVTAIREKAEGSYILNFFVDETGIIRSTLEDRAATGADPPL